MSGSKYFDSIRIDKGKKGKKPSEPEKRICQWEGCEKPGAHKAPLGRDREGQYLWMCLAHVQEYNKNYNYFSGLDDDAIAKFQKEANTGHRPTYPLGENPWGAGKGADNGAPDGADKQAARGSTSSGTERIYNRSGYASRARAGRLSAKPTRKLKALEKKSFEDMNLAYNATSAEIKSRYKLLVKQNHPDANGGDRSSEERLRQIIKAYKILQQAGFC